MVNSSGKHFLKLILVLLIIVSATPLFAQTRKENTINYHSVKLPDSLMKSTQEIANYFNTNYVGNYQRSKAIYEWITNTFSYDLENFLSLSEVKEEDIIPYILTNRKGVCTHYAYLYSEVANLCGIKTHLVTGYVKQGGEISQLTHMWCASLIDSTWYLVDPTWGAGSVNENQFLRKATLQYFTSKIIAFGESHMPFDPIWQLRITPISFMQFDNNLSVVVGPKMTPIDFQSKIAELEAKTEVEQAFNTIERIKQLGPANKNVYLHIRDLTRKIDNHNSGYYRKSIISYYRANNLLNQFMLYRYSQSILYKEDRDIISMIDSAQFFVEQSRKYNQAILQPEQYMLESLNEINTFLNETQQLILEQQIFLKKYINTKKRSRPFLLMRQNGTLFPAGY
jgi:hypothetical protein